jgi:hypothetical protein
MAERTVSVKLRMDVAEYMANAQRAGRSTRDLEKASRDLRTALRDEETAAGRVRVAEAELNELRESGKAKVSQLAAAEEKLAEAHRRQSAAQAQVVESTRRWEQAQRAAEDSMDGLDRRLVLSARNAQFSAAQYIGAFAGLPAAAAVAGVGVAAGLGVVPLAFAAAAAAAVKSDAAVTDSWGDLGDRLRTSATGWAAPFAAEFVDAAHRIGSTVDNLEPQITTVFRNAAGDVDILTGSVTDLVTNAMPGLVVASSSAEQPLLGVRNAAAQAGAGVTDFYRNISAGADSSRGIIETTGGALRDLLGTAGKLAANLANNGGPAVQGFRADLQQLEDVAVSLTSSYSPLYGATEGFLSTTAGGLGVLRAFAAGLAYLPEGADHAAGSLFAAQKIASLFGTSLTGTGFGLRAFSTEIDAAGNKTTPFQRALNDTEAGGSRLTRGLGAIVSSGFNPLGLALVGGSILLDQIGQKQQEAAQKAAEHKEAVRALTQAYQEDNGVLGQNVKVAQAAAFTAKNVAGNAAAAGLGLGLYTSAADGNSLALREVTNRTNEVLAATLRAAGGTDRQVQVLQGYNNALLTNGGTAADYAAQLDQINRQYNDAAGHVTNLSAAQRNQIDAILNASGALGDQIRAQREAHDQYVLSESALTGLTAAEIENRDATQKATQAIYDQQNAHLGYRGALLSTKDAQDQYNAALRSGNQDQVAEATLRLEQAFAAQEQAAYNAAYADSTATTEAGRVADAQRAANQETVNLASSFSGVLPASLQQTISKMGITAAQAVGLRVEIDNTGAAVYRLPDGKTIRIAGDTSDIFAKINAASGYIDAFVNKRRLVVINTVVHGPNQATLTGPRAAFAQGGIAVPLAAGGVVANAVGRQLTPMLPIANRVPPNTWRVVGDNLSVPEYYIPANGSARSRQILLQALMDPRLGGLATGNGRLVDAANSLAAKSTPSGVALANGIRSGTVVTRGAGGRGPVMLNMAINVNIPNYVGSRSELLNTLRREIRNAGGNVQKVLGR